MRPLLCSLLAFISFHSLCLANTEKLIFVAPGIDEILHEIVLVKESDGGTLTPSSPSLRTAIPVAFPTTSQPNGETRWYLLEDLRPGQRYEVRICWAAIQPTSFWLDLPELNNARQTRDPQRNQRSSTDLRLRIEAAADFYTANGTLMSHPPLVDVELILDPYIANVFPRSLVSTALYIVVLAAIALYVSNVVWSALALSNLAKGHND